MERITTPRINDIVEVTTDWSDLFAPYASYVSRLRNVVGTRVQSAKHDPAGTWRLQSGGRVHIVEPKRVIKIRYISGTGGDEVIKPKMDVRSWKVPGSKGSVYDVEQSGLNYSCTCKAFSFRKTCKHIDSVKVQK